MKAVLKQLKRVYIKNRMDIMGFKVTKKNPLTYHHVIEKRELAALGFPDIRTFENGLPLTLRGHQYLHFIETFDPLTYDNIRKIIILITHEKRFPNPNERKLIQIYLSYFEYELEDNHKIDNMYLKREKK